MALSIMFQSFIVKPDNRIGAEDQYPERTSEERRGHNREGMDIPVAAVSARPWEIYVNRACGLGRKEWRFLLDHEYPRAVLGYDPRRGYREPELWNVDCDYVVNGWRTEMNVSVVPEFGLLEAADFPKDAPMMIIIGGYCERMTTVYNFKVGEEER